MMGVSWSTRRTILTDHYRDAVGEAGKRHLLCDASAAAAAAASGDSASAAAAAASTSQP